MDRLLLCLLLFLVPIGEGLRSRCGSIVTTKLHAISPTSAASSSSAAQSVRPAALQSIAPLATVGNVDLFIQDGWRGVRASKDLSRGDCLISLPFQACLVATSHDKDCPPGYETLWREVKDVRYRLAIQLLREWRKGPASPFFPYIVNLPAAAPADDPNAIKPIHWTRAELAHFPYVNLAVEAIKQQKNWLALYDQLLTHPDFRQSQDRPQLLLEVRSAIMEAIETVIINMTVVLAILVGDGDGVFPSIPRQQQSGHPSNGSATAYTHWGIGCHFGFSDISHAHSNRWRCGNKIPVTHCQ